MSVNSSLAFIFPGQGSQKLGMLSDYYQEYAIIRDTFNEANEVLGFNLWDIILNDENRLNQTIYTQPALLAASIAVFRLLELETAVQPTLMAGHSLGEYSALVAANAISFADGLRLVHARGQYMQEAVPSDQGAMSVFLGLDDKSVDEICQKAQEKGVVSAANFNSPGQVVVAGEYHAVIYALELAKEKGAKRAQLLPVSVPSHCLLMKPAADKLIVNLNQINIQKPQTSIIHNVDLETHDNADDIREALIKQLYKPVRWTETIQLMSDEKINTFVEIGSGRVLTGLNKRIVKTNTYLYTDNLASFHQVLESLA